VTAELRAALPLGEPFHDPAVGHFGLRNAVMALGDTFVEVVSPVREDTAAGRHLDRLGGDGGYMAMFQLDDLGAARRRVDELGVRVVWDVQLEDIEDVHLHPADMGGAIVAIDRATPPGSWRWGGPAWEGRVPEHSSGGLTGMTMRARDPVAMAERWGAVLGRPVRDGAIALDGGEVRFAAGESDGIVAFHLDGPVDAEVAGVRFATAG
jgi:hypothetical protein